VSSREEEFPSFVFFSLSFGKCEHQQRLHVKNLMDIFFILGSITIIGFNGKRLWRVVNGRSKAHVGR
jgi:hypothetical protein